MEPALRRCGREHESASAHEHEDLLPKVDGGVALDNLGSYAASAGGALRSKRGRGRAKQTAAASAFHIDFVHTKNEIC